MSNFILNRVVIGDKTVVRYLMKQRGGNVTGCTSPESALWMLTNDKAKVPHMTEEFPGFPVTADGVYFFDGKVESEEAPAPNCGPDYCEIPAAELGGDGLPMPAGAEKPKRKKRVKDVVCE